MLKIFNEHAQIDMLGIRWPTVSIVILIFSLIRFGMKHLYVVSQENEKRDLADLPLNR